MNNYETYNSNVKVREINSLDVALEKYLFEVYVE